MNSRAKGVAASKIRVPIPCSVKKTIDNINQITGQNHCEDEIYAMLKKCFMDPDETALKLLLLDTSHEVKRKKDRRKEKLNKEPTKSKKKPAKQARVTKARCGNYPSRYTSQDAGGRINPAAAKGITPTPPLENGTSKSPLVTAHKTKKSSAAAVSNGPSGITSLSTNPLLENPALRKSDPTLVVLSSDDDDSNYDDCVVLDGNPEKPVMVLNDGNDDSDDLVIVAEKGEISCRDFCHSRHLCVKFPFASTPHRVHCSQCYCYACDSLAPCTYWDSNIPSDDDHCHANDKDDYWIAYRKSMKETSK